MAASNSENSSKAASTHTSRGKPVDLREILADQWMPMRVGEDCFVFHVPSSSLLAIPQDVFASFEHRGEAAAANIPELQAFINALPKDQEDPSPKIKFNGIAMNVAEVCNLRCKYCYAGDGNYGADSLMTWDIAEKTLEFFLSRVDRLHIVFFGGEPMLNFDLIKKIVAWCETRHDKSFSYSMTTNATLLTAVNLAWLKEKGFSLSISWDGHGIHGDQRLTKERTENSEDLVARKLAQFEAQIAGLKGAQLRGTVMEHNITKMEEGIVATLNGMPHAYMSSLATHSSDFEAALPGIKQAQEIVRRVVTRILDNKEYDKLKRFRTIWQFVSKIHRRERRSMTCGAGLNYFSVSTTGKFYLCHRFTEDESELMGDAFKGFDQKRLDQIRNHRLAKHKPCSACWMRETCAGGCFHENKIANNTEFFADPKFCLTQHLLMSLGVEVYVRLLKEAPHVLDKKKVNWRTENV